MLELFYTCVKCTLNTKNPLLPPQKSVKVDLIQENTGSFTTKKLLFSYEKYENAYAKRGVTVNPTIYDVSRLSGVSIATVSRAFSNPERVREDTRRKVFEAAEVLHYSPNAIARAMARQRTDKIAFLICKEGATILDEFYAGICTGIMRETNRSDFELVISTAADWDTASNTSKNKQVEGVILGLAGGIIAFFCQWGIYGLITRAMMESGIFSIITTVPFGNISHVVLLVFLLVGFAIGGGGSVMAIRKFLKV